MPSTLNGSRTTSAGRQPDMRLAADYAAMADPAMNRQFSRRWRPPPEKKTRARWETGTALRQEIVRDLLTPNSDDLQTAELWARCVGLLG